jgi:predicted nucleotidyltransferase
MKIKKDPILTSIVRTLRQKYKCHTIILYGSRARGLTTATSDYDVFGVSRNGEKTRLAKKQKGYYWDVFVYPEKDLRKLGEQHFLWKGARIVYEKGSYGEKLLKRLDKILKTPFKPQPQYEIDITKVWAQKELDRCRMTDIQGLFRRAELHNALINHYFFMRQIRFLGPKEAFAWLEENDLKTFKLIQRTLKYPRNLACLKAAASAVYMVALK